MQAPDFNGQLRMRTWMSQPGQNYEGGKLAAAPETFVGVSKVCRETDCVFVCVVRVWACVEGPAVSVGPVYTLCACIHVRVCLCVLHTH